MLGLKRESKLGASRILSVKGPNCSPHPTSLQIGVRREHNEVYNPQKVLRRFEYDQGTTHITGMMPYSSELVAMNMFVGAGWLQILVEARAGVGASLGDVP